MIEVRCEECGHINEAGPSDPFQEAFAYAIDGDSELLRLYHTSSQFKVTLDTMLRALPSYVRSLAEQADAASKLSPILPQEALWTDVLGASPQKVARLRTASAQGAFDALLRGDAAGNPVVNGNGALVP